MTAEKIDEFWSKVFKKSNGCWMWTGASRGGGYGSITIDGKSRGAHRVSWEIANGNIPNGKQVLHRCDVPSCVNPKHLFLGNHYDNMRDMCKKGRHTPSPGERNGGAKLSESIVKQILLDSVKGLSHTKLALKYQIPKPTACKIASGKTWKYLRHKPKKHRPEAYRGSKNGAAKLNEALVKQMRQEYKTGNYSYAKLGKLHSLPQMTVWHALNDAWQHI